MEESTEKTGDDIMRSAPKLNPEYVIDVNGNKKAVILSIEEYEELIEDLRDLAVIAERREEPVIPHAEAMEDIGLAQAIQEGLEVRAEKGVPLEDSEGPLNG